MLFLLATRKLGMHQHECVPTGAHSTSSIHSNAESYAFKIGHINESGRMSEIKRMDVCVCVREEKGGQERRRMSDGASILHTMYIC